MSGVTHQKYRLWVIKRLVKWGADVSREEMGDLNKDKVYQVGADAQEKWEISPGNHW